MMVCVAHALNMKLSDSFLHITWLFLARGYVTRNVTTLSSLRACRNACIQIFCSEYSVTKIVCGLVSPASEQWLLVGKAWKNPISLSLYYLLGSPHILGDRVFFLFRLLYGFVQSLTSHWTISKKKVFNGSNKLDRGHCTYAYAY